jgi:peroxiredoxin
MDWTLLATRVALGIVFVTAGLAKLLDREGSKKTFQDFGLPLWAAQPLGFGLPAAEITVAFLLLPVRSAWIGALGALALLVMFSTVIALNLALGRRPACHCFGQIHTEPIGWRTVARNGGLASLAGFLVWRGRTTPGPSILSIIRGFTNDQVVAGTFGLLTLVALAGLSWLILHLFRQNGRLLLRIEALEVNRSLGPQIPARPVFQGLTIGTKAIQFELPDLQGSQVSLDGLLRDGKPLLLISTDPKCGPCKTLMPDVAGWQKEFAADINISLLSHGSRSENRIEAAQHGLVNVLIEKDTKIAEKYQMLGTPTAVVIRADGTIGSPAVAGAEAIRRLLSNKAWTESGLAEFMRTLTQPPKAPQRAAAKPTLPIGSPAPPFTLPDLDANRVGTTNFNGNGTVLLFWNPGCGFCQRMLPDLHAWEKNKGSRSPRLVLVSGGSVEANREMRLHSTVLLDEKFSVGQLYGASGTPSALLIAATGKIGSGLAIGAPGVLGLLEPGKASQDSTARALATAE